MRLRIIAGFGAIALGVAGCVAPVPMGAPGTVPPITSTPVAPTILDGASRQIARNVINTEMQSRLPGVNVAPYTDCVVNNATTAELIDIAQATRAGVSGTANSVAAIVQRPTTTQCIAAAARPMSA